MKKLKILIINPNSDEHTKKIIEKKIKLLNWTMIDFDVVSLKTTPKLISTPKDIAKALPEMENIILTGEEYDAFIIACHSDPNLQILKNMTVKPVVGIAEASMKIASMEGNNFAVISPSAASIPRKKHLAHQYCCDFYYQAAAVCSEINDKVLCNTAKKVVQNDHVDTIVLGCANYANADRYIEQHLHVKVIDGVACAIFIAIGLVNYDRYKNKGVD